jgi:hypothetical protein
MRKQYHELTKKQLYKRLEKRGLPFNAIKQIIDRAQTKRRYELKIARLRNQTSDPWNVLINALLAEMNTTRAKIGHYKKNEMYQHRTLYEQYLRVQQKLLPTLRAYQRQGELTPLEAAKRQKYTVADEGAHWTDWIPRKIKLAFAQEQQQLPTNTHARNRAPLFEKNNYTQQRALTREKRLNVWREDRAMHDAQLADAEMRGLPNQIAYAQHVIACIDRAIAIARDMPLHKATPKSWMALTPTEDAQEIERLSNLLVTYE